MSDEYRKLKAQVDAANRAVMSPEQIAAGFAHDEALSQLMGEQAEQRLAERRKAIEAEQRRQEEAREAEREQAEDKHMASRRDWYLRNGGTEAGWRSVKAQVLQEYRERFLGGDQALLAAKRASGLYDL